jgi:hypothetical protein
MNIYNFNTPPFYSHFTIKIIPQKGAERRVQRRAEGNEKMKIKGR